ncbi:MAG: hypothetical protein GY737_18505 [Desulfobacteraceae bacterium]|nr:hypothetical protein [Desulfobacteraceae bacterium]
MTPQSEFTREVMVGQNSSMARQVNFFRMTMVLSMVSLFVLVTCWCHAWPYLFSSSAEAAFAPSVKADDSAPRYSAAEATEPVRFMEPPREAGEEPNGLVFDTIPKALDDGVAIETVNGVIRKGDTASTLLNDYLPLTLIYELCRQSKSVYPLTQIKIGQPYNIRVRENALVEFGYEIDPERQLVVQRVDDRFSIEICSADLGLSKDVRQL